MKIFNYIERKCKIRRLRNLSAEILYGYTNAEGKYLKDTRVSSSTVIENAEKLRIEDNVFIGHHNFIEASNVITIEEGCQVTNFISILSHSSHISVRLYGKGYRSSPELKGYVKGPVHIGKYSFVGPHTTIMPNTNIGKGCLIGAFSLVSGEFPDFSIIKGNPAKVVGSTKDMDNEYLKDSELLKYYNEWAKD